MLDFEDEQKTQPIAYETLAEVARKWHQELKSKSAEDPTQIHKER